jgi:hypothetical protein
MRWLLLLALLGGALVAQEPLGGEGLELQIEPIDEDRGRYQLRIDAGEAQGLGDELEVRPGDGDQRIILRRNEAALPDAPGDQLYEAVDFLPADLSQPYYLRGLYGKNDDTAVLIRFILFRW